MGMLQITGPESLVVPLGESITPSGEGLRYTVAGDTSKVELVIRDEWGNLRDGDGVDDTELIEVDFKDAANYYLNTTMDPAQAPQTQSLGQGSGKYEVTYKLTQSGRWPMDVKVNGKLLPG